MPRRLELDVTYAARRPWAPRRAQFANWVSAALERRTAVSRGALETRAGVSQAALEARAAVSRAALEARATVSRAAPVVVSIRVVGAARSRALNARYRRRDRPTNVLSFGGAGTVPDGRNFLGELVICAPVVAREAGTQGKSREAHWAHMTVHGVLHLLGFDHERSADARKMAAREIQILDRLGFSNPYA